MKQLNKIIKNRFTPDRILFKSLWWVPSLMLTSFATTTQGTLIVELTVNGYESTPADTDTLTAAELGSNANVDANLGAFEISTPQDTNEFVGFNGMYGFRNSDNGLTTPVNEQDAVDNDYYLEFTIDPNPGFMFSLDTTNSIQVATRRWGEGNPTPSDATMFLRSDADSFAATLDTSFNSERDDLISFDVSGFENITNATTFRIYAYDSTDPFLDTFVIHTNGSLGNSGSADFVINGSVTAVPEPSTYGLISGISVLGLLLVRRQKGKQPNV